MSSTGHCGGNWLGRQVFQVLPATIGGAVVGGIAGMIIGSIIKATPASYTPGNTQGDINNASLQGAVVGLLWGIPIGAGVFFVASEVFATIQSCRGKSIYGRWCHQS